MALEEFIWTDWNLQKIDNHALSAEEVEKAWHHRFDVMNREHPVNGPYTESIGQCPSGRWITMIWRYNEGADGNMVFIVTAY